MEILIGILLIVIGLAVATVWFVALPAFERQPHAKRSCEVVVLESGATRCVRDPTRGSRAAGLELKRSVHVKR